MKSIHSDTFSFMKELAKNNNRDWFNSNRERYASIREGFAEFLEDVYQHLLEIDPALEGIDVRKSIFRINRDVRFSDDKSPYKTTLAAVFIAGGRKKFSERAGYYIHIENGNSLIAGGAYLPPSPWINSIRSKIDTEGERLRRIVGDDSFTSYFGSLDGEMLKGAPRGFTADHPHIDLLRYKSLMAVRNLTNEEALSAGLGNLFIDGARAMKPLNDFLNEAAIQ